MKIVHRLRSEYNRLFSPHHQASYQRTPIYNRWKKPRILLYADSRGINIPDHYDYKHYSTRLIAQHNVYAHLCPEKWTTILDFLQFWGYSSGKKYDYVVLHAGVVDASPRQQKTMLGTIYPEKKRIFDEVFSCSLIQQYLHTDLNCEYEEDKTINMYSLDMAEKYVIPRLLEIPNLIWIGINKVDMLWRGNYWKDRPQNIRIIEDYSRLFARSLPSTIDLLNLWRLEEIRDYTFDNIHPNKQGSDFIYQELIKQFLSTRTK